MFDIFKRNEDKGPKDIKTIRETLLQFIKSELQKAEGGEGRYIKGINLYIAADSTDKHLYEAAVYQDEPDRFKDEIQKIADDYALGLPARWAMSITFEEGFPPEAIKVKDLNAAIFIRTKDNVVRKKAEAYLLVLSGKAELEEYQISSDDPKLNIGREKNVQVNEGFFRLNHIAFPGDSENPANRYISRQHAHIEWNADDAVFMIFADEGGVPPGNKLKVRSAASEELIKLNSTHIGHKLMEGDQIIIGESAVLAFSSRSQSGNS